MFTMKHYYWEKDEKITVQNCVGTFMGQEHTHTKEDFEKWVKENKFPVADVLDKRRKIKLAVQPNFPDAIALRVLAEKVAYMSRAEMASMRTYFRKQVGWKLTAMCSKCKTKGTPTKLLQTFPTTDGKGRISACCKAKIILVSK